MQNQHKINSYCCIRVGCSLFQSYPFCAHHCQFVLLLLLPVQLLVVLSYRWIVHIMDINAMGLILAIIIIPAQDCQPCNCACIINDIIFGIQINQ